jgi:hypothetical protein
MPGSRDASKKNYDRIKLRFKKQDLFDEEGNPINLETKACIMGISVCDNPYYRDYNIMLTMLEKAKKLGFGHVGLLLCDKIQMINLLFEKILQDIAENIENYTPEKIAELRSDLTSNIWWWLVKAMAHYDEAKRLGEEWILTNEKTLLDFLNLYANGAIKAFEATDALGKAKEFNKLAKDYNVNFEIIFWDEWCKLTYDQLRDDMPAFEDIQNRYANSPTLNLGVEKTAEGHVKRFLQNNVVLRAMKNKISNEKYIFFLKEIESLCRFASVMFLEYEYTYMMYGGMFWFKPVKDNLILRASFFAYAQVGSKAPEAFTAAHKHYMRHVKGSLMKWVLIEIPHSVADLVKTNNENPEAKILASSFAGLYEHFQSEKSEEKNKNEMAVYLGLGLNKSWLPFYKRISELSEKNNCLQIEIQTGQDQDPTELDVVPGVGRRPMQSC